MTPLPSGRGVVKIWGLLFFGYSQKFVSELVSLYSAQTPVSSRIKVKNPNDRSLKPSRPSFSPYQMIHSVEIERGRVSRYQISSILPIKCYYHHFFMPGVVTNSWISHKLIFHVVIPHEFQCRRKMMENWRPLMYLSIPNENQESGYF